MHLTTTKVIEITMCSIRLRYDYDEKMTRSFFAQIKSHRMEACTREMS